MNVASLLSKAYRITNTNSTTFLDGNSTNVLAELNTCYGHRTLDIKNLRVDFNSLIKEVYTDLLSTDGLVAGDLGFNGEYPFDTDTFNPVRFEVSYDGTTWRTCQVYDIAENTSGSEHNEDSIQSIFSESNPFVRFERDSYFIRPLKTTADDVTAGIHIWYEKRQSDLTTGSPDFETNLHDILVYDLAYLERLMHPAKYSNEWRNDFDMERAKMEKRFNEFMKNRFKRNMKMDIDYSDTNISYK